MSCCTIFRMHDVHSVCFVNTDLRSLTITCIIYTHVLQMSCMWIKDGFHFKFNSAQVSGLPTELPTISILESSGLPTELPTELLTVSIYVSSGQPNLHGKIPMGSPLLLSTELPTFSYLEVVGCPLSCPLFPYKEVVGSLICMAKFPWAAMGSPLHCPLSCQLFSYFGSSGLPTELPTELPTVSIYGSSGQTNLHGKIPMGSPQATNSVANVQPMGSEVGSSPVFFLPYGISGQLVFQQRVKILPLYFT